MTCFYNFYLLQKKQLLSIDIDRLKSAIFVGFENRHKKSSFANPLTLLFLIEELKYKKNLLKIVEKEFGYEF